jgi:dTDP-4-dehydrorhamnose 3,5-epimerase-like enzyme
MVFFMSNEPDSLKVKACRLWRLPTFVDARGRLTSAELDALPFAVRRIAFISGVPAGQTRGAHAHRVCQEFLLAVTGTVSITLDDGACKQDVVLQDAGLGLVVAPKVWNVLDRFSEGAVLAVLASDPYDAADYIKDYDEFLAAVAAS